MPLTTEAPLSVVILVEKYAKWESEINLTASTYYSQEQSWKPT